MVTKKKSVAYVCENCGADSSKWSGQCSQCKAWNSLKEFKQESMRESRGQRFQGYSSLTGSVQDLSNFDTDELSRIASGSQELDRVLGGGMVPGSVVLISGDPGSGKSTLLLQTLAHVSRQGRVLYVSGEESIQQIAIRAKRLGLTVKNLKTLTETSVEHICGVADQEKPEVIVIDSIQVMYSDKVDSAPGSVSQVRECAALLAQFAKATNMVLLIVGHVTKDQNIAGPMTLSHIVDAQLMLSSTTDTRYRIIRATKNRFGAVNEIGLFAMTDKGLKEVKNPSAMFLSRGEEATPGSVVNVLWEGTRPLLVEIQALVVESQFGNPRRLGVGIDQSRIAMLLAVLARHGGIFTGDQDVFVNCVGGIRVTETSADLAVVLGIISSLKNVVLPQDMLAFGEIGLSGEVRPVANGEARIKEASKHGFKQAIIPKANVSKSVLKEGIKLNAVNTLHEVLEIF